MNELLPDWGVFSTFVLASAVLAVLPGPAVFYVLTRSLVQGRRSGMVSVAAIALGNLGNVLAVSLGIAALFAVYPVFLFLFKWVGAMYLVFIGGRMLLVSGKAVAASPATVSPGPVFRDGVIVAFFNPKTTVFFAAFLPQFLGEGAHPLQGAVLGGVFVLIAAASDCMYVLAAGMAAPALKGAPVRVAALRLGGAVWIALGIYAVLTGEMPG